MSYLTSIMQPVWLRPKPCHPKLEIYSQDEANVIQYLADNLCDCHQKDETHPHPVPSNHTTDCQFVLFIKLMVRLQDYRSEE